MPLVKSISLMEVMSLGKKPTEQNIVPCEKAGIDKRRPIQQGRSIRREDASNNPQEYYESDEQVKARAGFGSCPQKDETVQQTHIGNPDCGRTPTQRTEPPSKRKRKVESHHSSCLGIWKAIREAS